MQTELDQLAFRFFKIFAQFEYALKAMGYGRATKSNAAEVDWDRFSNEIGAAVMDEQSEPIIMACKYLLGNPPKHQVWVDGAVLWRTASTDERTPQVLFAHIRRVRNNLYHGGKFNSKWLAPDRSTALISHSLIILEHLVASNQMLKEAIQGNAA